MSNSLIRLVLLASLPIAVGSTTAFAAGRRAIRGKARAAARTANLVLRIRAQKTKLKPGERPQVTIEIHNRGRRPVTLIQPGDGSGWGWRTPLIAWSVLRGTPPRSAHPTKPPILRSPRCGNMNPMRSQEIVVLKPGKRMRVAGWVHTPHFHRAGRYQAVFYYTNDPRRTVRGLTLSIKGSRLARRIRASTPVALVSNELVFTVTR